MKLCPVKSTNEELLLSYIEEADLEIVDDLLAELCERIQHQVEKIVGPKYAKRPLPDTSPEDIVQGIIAVLMEHLRNLKEDRARRGIDNFQSYVTQVTFNEYDRQAKRSHHSFQTDSYDAADSLLHKYLVDPTPSPEEQAAIKEALEKIWPRVWKLPPAQFTAFFLLQNDGLGTDMANLCIELDLCKPPLLAQKMGISEQKLEAVLKDRRRTAATVGTIMNLSAKEVYGKQAAATKKINRHKNIFSRWWNSAKK